MSQKIELTFHIKPPAKKDTGLKLVIWEILIPPVKDEEPTIKHDWGFANWNGEGWDGLDLPEGWVAVVVRWANTIDPEIMLAEKSKIILLN